MKTKEIKINPDNIDASLVGEAGKILADGGLVAFPTETVYGLGANALNDKAVNSIFDAKGRPNDNPLIVHVAKIEDVGELVEEIPEKAKLVMENFWPGPISIIMKKSDKIGDAVSAGLKTVAVRMPSHPVARAVIEAAGVPVAAPSANTSGKPSPTAAEHVKADMDGKIDMIIDGGRCEVGVESTVLDLSGENAVILRPGGIGAEELEMVIGKVESPEAKTVCDKETPKCPGMKYKHYAPEASVIVIECNGSENREKVGGIVDKYKAQNKCVGVLSCIGEDSLYGEDIHIYAGKTSSEYAENMFYSLRKFDELGADVVICPIAFTDDMSIAVRNRLYKAASGNVITLDK